MPPDALVVLQDALFHLGEFEVQLGQHLDAQKGVLEDFLALLGGQGLGFFPQERRNLAHARVVEEQAQGSAVEALAVFGAFAKVVGQDLNEQLQPHQAAVHRVVGQGVLFVDAPGQGLGPVEVLPEVFGEDQDVGHELVRHGLHGLVQEFLHAPGQSGLEDVGDFELGEMAVHEDQVELVGDMLHVDRVVCARNEDEPVAHQLLELLGLFLGEPFPLLYRRGAGGPRLP